MPRRSHEVNQRSREKSPQDLVNDTINELDQRDASFQVQASKVVISITISCDICHGWNWFQNGNLSLWIQRRSP